jgi:hypothetical protein
MPTVLQRLYRTKLMLIATVSMSCGIVALTISFLSRWHWLDNSPIDDIGAALLTTGLIAIVFEFFDSRDAEARMQAAIEAKAPALRDSVIAGLATMPDDLARLASPATLDAIISNSLAARIGNPELAADMVASLQTQIQRIEQPHRYDAHATISLSPWEHGPRTGAGAMFVATTRWQYATPRDALRPLMRFSSVADPAEYRRRIYDPTSVETWLIYRAPESPAANTDYFQLLRCAVNGREQPIKRRADGDGQLFTVTPELDPGDDSDRIHVSYTHRTLIRKHKNRYFVDFATTKGLRVDFSCTPDCGIRNLDVLDYTAGTPPRIEHSPPGIAPSVSLDYGENWIYPRSGAVITWETAQRNQTH